MEVGLGNNSHLFHDSKYGDACSKLDVKEQIETRERNRREDRAFQYKTRILERANEVTKKSMEHEARILREGLKDIQAKTPYFEDLYKPSKAKMYSSASGSKTFTGNPLLKYASHSFPNTSGYSQSSPAMLGEVSAQDGHHHFPELQELSPAFSRIPRRHTMYVTSAIEPDQVADQDSQNLKSSTKNYIRKSRYITNSLGNIYRHRNELLNPPIHSDSKVGRLNGFPSTTLVRAHFILQSYRPLQFDDDVDDKQADQESDRSEFSPNLSLKPRGLDELSDN